jgi:hypothetical protein
MCTTCTKSGGFNLSRPETIFTLAYQLTDNWVINEDNLMKLNGKWLKMVLGYY